MEPEKKSNGALIGSIIVIAIIIVGGIYIWKSKVSTPKENTPTSESSSLDAKYSADIEELDGLAQDLNNANIELEASVIDSLE